MSDGTKSVDHFGLNVLPSEGVELNEVQSTLDDVDVFTHILNVPTPPSSLLGFIREGQYTAAYEGSSKGREPEEVDLPENSESINEVKESDDDDD